MDITDWFLPSKDELTAMYTELVAHGVGGFITDPDIGDLYWSSTENNVGLVNCYMMYTIGVVQMNKEGFGNTRACRVFTSLTSYALRDIGPAGGLIFWKNGNDYLEAAPTDQSFNTVWSNITTIIGASAQGTAIGTGPANTTAIIGQVGHTNSAAKLCNDLIISVTTSYTPPVPIVSSPQRIYTFYITIGSSLREVFPLNFLESKLVDEPEKDQAYYRRKFSGTLTFTNIRGDFDLLNAIHEVDPCEKILFQIKRAGILYWPGYFTTTNGKWDFDRCTFEINPLSDDDYVDILENADNQYDILHTNPGLTPITTRAVQGTIDITFTRNRWLIDVIEYLADKIKPGVTVSSEFFTNVINPATLGPNNLLLLTIAAKSDIKRPTTTDPARWAMMSWNDLMQILWGMFQVQWNYDSSIDTIHIEHISWFTSSLGMDLRPQLLTKATNKFSYATEKMPKSEKFSFMEANNPSFIGLPIEYLSNCVNSDPKQNVKETSVPVTTDLDFIINDNPAVSDNGFVILCNYESGGNYYVKLNSSALQSDVRLNMDLSWGNLHDRFFRHDRVLLEGIMNGMFTHFWSAQKNKKQECFAIVCHSDNYNPANEIITELGETYLGNVKASVEQSELSPSGEMKFSLLYGPHDNAQTPILDLKWILLWEDGCGALHAQLSEPADDDLDIQIIYVIFNADGSPLCNSGAGVTWTIPLGSTTDDFTIPASDCDPGDIPENGCIWYSPDSPYHFEVVERTDWVVAFIKDTDCDCDSEDVS